MMVSQFEILKDRAVAAMKWKVIQSLDQVRAFEWNRCIPPDYPFLRYEFLNALERSGCVSEDTGWRTMHIVLRNSAAETSRISGVLPLYQKYHSWGEFIFDWQWEHAYFRSGLAYYPKLVSVSPFTGLSAPKLLFVPDVLDDGVRERLADACIEVAGQSDVSSMHLLFLNSDDLDLLSGKGLISRRSSITYVWTNRDYDTMEDFLATLSSRKRKKIRQERKSIQSQGIEIRVIPGRDMTEYHLQVFEMLYHSTISKYGSIQYLNRRFLELILRSMPDNILFILAQLDGQPIAGGLFYQGGQTLYGRYWGALRNVPNLHFEVCYYAAIEYCIQEGLIWFNAGIQGEHKLSRGFLPEACYSAHMIKNPEFSEAIRESADFESFRVEAHCDHLTELSAYAKNREPGQ